MKSILPAGIEANYLKSDFQDFINNYDLALLEFADSKGWEEMTDYVKENGWDGNKTQDSWEVIPDDRVETEFLQALLKFITIRREELMEFHVSIPLTEQFKRRELQENDLEFRSSLAIEKENEIVREETRAEFHSYFQKIKFLKFRAAKLGYQVSTNEDVVFVKQRREEMQILDLSNTRATEKLVYLQELGVIDHLRKLQPFKHSINKLATVLSAITNEQPTTLQPALNAMLSSTNSPQKSPYNSEKTVSKIKANLADIGFVAK